MATAADTPVIALFISSSSSDPLMAALLSPPTPVSHFHPEQTVRERLRASSTDGTGTSPEAGRFHAVTADRETPSRVEKNRRSAAAKFAEYSVS